MNTTTTKDTPQSTSSLCSPFARRAIIDGKRVEHWNNDKASLDEPLHWRAPKLIFVCAHGDLFHESVPAEWIDKVFAVMALCPQHTFQVLTKRPERMRDYITSKREKAPEWIEMPEVSGRVLLPYEGGVPRNVWLGTSVEDQAHADERIPELLATPAAIRFISAEPLLGPIDLTRIAATEGSPGGQRLPLGDFTVGMWESHRAGLATASPTISAFGGEVEQRLGYGRLDWVIVGGESGKHARPMHPDWARSLRDQCAAAGVPFLFKQWGAWAPADTSRHRDWYLVNKVGDWDLPDERVPIEDMGEVALRRAGKKAAGRLLDGVQHDGMPAR